MTPEARAPGRTDGPDRPVPGAPVEVVPCGPVRGRIAAPASKSVTNRLLAVAALADGDSLLRGPLRSDDSAVMRRFVTALGAEVADVPGGWRVRGTAGRLRAPAGQLDAGLSGTTLRFGTALATLAPAPATVSGAPPLLRRPVGPLVAALRALGADVRDRDGLPPVVCAGGGLAGGQASVDASASTQFASAVLLVAPYARTPVRLRVHGAGASAYVELTVAVLRDWGVPVAVVDDGAWDVPAPATYAARDRLVDYDASAAAHLLSLAAATAGTVTVTNAAGGAGQPDAAFPDVLATMGAQVTRGTTSVTVTGPEVLAPVDVDLAAMPDQVTSLAALAALADGESVIRGVAVARGHETDRLAALAAELGKLGVAVRELPDGLRIRGGRPAGPALLATHDDHRLAMAFAALAARVPGVVVDEPWCVTKTYPGFWQDLRALGVAWRERRP